MVRKPSSQLHLPLLAVLLVSLIISIATLACAATTLGLFNSQQTTNPWLLPLWRNHFDLRGLKLVVGTSAAIALLDIVAVVAMLLLAVQVNLQRSANKKFARTNFRAILFLVLSTNDRCLHHSSLQYLLAPLSSYQR